MAVMTRLVTRYLGIKTGIELVSWCRDTRRADNGRRVERREEELMDWMRDRVVDLNEGSGS
jgi:hypothetical protein